MDHSMEIAKLCSVRRLTLPHAPRSAGSPVRSEALPVFLPVQEHHQSLYQSLFSMGILELYPISRGLPLPSPAQARSILQKNFPAAIWQEDWDPIPLDHGRFLVRFSSRDALLRAFREGVKWGVKFSYSIRPWSFREGGSPAWLSIRALLRLTGLPLLLWDSDSIGRIISGFGLLDSVVPAFGEVRDFSSLDLHVRVQDCEAIPKLLAVTLGASVYSIAVELLELEMASPLPSPLPIRVEGEPGWGEFSGIPDRILDDISDPIEVDSNPSDEEEPSETLPAAGPSDDLPSAAMSTGLTLFPYGRDEAIDHLAFDAPRLQTFSLFPASPLTVGSAVFSLSDGFLRLAVSPTRAIPPSSPWTVLSLSFGQSPPQVGTIPSVLSFSSAMPLPSLAVDAASAFASSPGTPEQSSPISASPVSRAASSRPSRPRAVLGVKTAAAKLLSKRKASSLLPLHSVPQEQLLAWGRGSGFHVSGDLGATFVASVRSLEEVKASPPVDPSS